MKATLQGLVLTTLVLARAASAQMQTEMTFGTPATNGSAASVPMDRYPSSLANGLLYLRGNGTRTTQIMASPTDIGRRWDERLRQGFLHVGPYTQANEPRNQVGTSTSDRMSYYLNLSSGDNIPGTMYMVFRPTSEWTTSHRRTLTGTGGTGWAYMRLWVPQSSSTLLFDYVRGVSNAASPKAKCQTSIAVTWDTNKWYFVATSWGYGAEPLLYLREMSPQGPEASPAATLGTLTTATGYQGTVPAGQNGMPFVRPLTIGAHYYDPGGNAGTIDGAAAHFAYVRLDTGLSTYVKIDEVFNSLGVPDESTVVSLR